jgi:hypothetical protein
MMTDTNKNLFNLDELSDYKAAENYNDVRGWDVKDANNRIIGKVNHLLVNKIAERVVYLDVEVDTTVIGEGHFFSSEHLQRSFLDDLAIFDTIRWFLGTDYFFSDGLRYFYIFKK